MSHSSPKKEDRPGILLSPLEQEHSQELGGSATLSPPPFSVTATGNPENSSQAQDSSRSAKRQQPASSVGSTESPATQTFIPPPFRVTATPLGQEEGSEEEIETKNEVEQQQFDDGTADEDAGAPSTPNDGNNSPPDQFENTTEVAESQQKTAAEQLSTSAGEPIPNKVRAKMEKAFQADFSNVRIHKSSSEAEELGALAFAYGDAIHFAPGQYQPISKEGQTLLGHELAHVMQQRQGKAEPSIQAKGAPNSIPGALPINNDSALELEANQMGAEAANATDTASENEEANGIIPFLMLLGERIDIDLSQVEDTTTISIDIDIIEGCTATRIEVVIEEGAFVSGTLFFQCTQLADVDLELTIAANGAVSGEISLQQEVMGFSAVANAQITEEGITGDIAVQLPGDLTIVGGLKVTGGLLYLNFGEEGTSFKGSIGVSLDNGFATGFAEVELDPKTNVWSGSALIQSTESININVAPGADIILPEGFEFRAQFGGEEGFSVEGSAMVTAQVILASTDGIEAGGTAELEASLTEDGLDFVLHKVRLVATGGLNAPDIDDALQAQHITSDMDAGAILTLSFEENSLSRIDLEVTGGISNTERRIGRLSFAGQATFNPFHFIGMLHAVTNAKFTLTQSDNYTTSLMPGSQLFVSVDESGVSNVDASLGLELADQESALAQLTVAASLPRGEGLSLSAKLELLRKLVLTTPEENGYGVAVLPTAGLTAKMVEGALREIQGSLPFEVADQEGDLLSGALEGKIAFSDGEGATLQNGQASATLLRELTLDIGAGEVRVLEGASIGVRIEAGQVVGLAGQVEAVYDNGSHEVSISANVDYDPVEKVLRSLDASMSTDETFSLFGGNLHVSEIIGSISIRNDEVISLGGHARLDATIGDFVLAGEADVTWSNAGDETSFVGSGWLEFSWFEEDNEHVYLNGRVEASIDGENFDLLGSINVGLMEGLSGQASVAMDQEMDPVISASLTYSAQLMEASELWSMEFGMGIQIPLIPALVTLEAGILFGMSINTRPLMVFGTVGVTDWRPSDKAFPDFYAELRASWGLDIEAKAMAYLELILGIDSILHLTGGIRAGVGLNIPIELSPYISLHGGEDGIGGEMGIDLSITPILKLLVDAYLEWGVLGIWEGEKIWGLVDQELAELGNIEWAGSFAFGENQEPSGEAPTVESQEVTPQGSPIAAPEGLNEGSSLGFGNQEQEPESSAGLTGMTDGLTTPTPEGAEQDVDQEGLGSELGQIGAYADGISAVGDLISVIADGFKALIKGGPVGLILWMIFEKPSKAEIQEKKDRVSEFRAALNEGDLIEPGSTIDLMLGILGGEYSFWIIFDQSKPFRDMVDRGLHEDATLEERSVILEGMIDGWTTESDETRIITVLDYTLNNEGAAGVRELTEYVGGEGRVRDQYEWTDWNDKDDLDRIFGRAYGNSSTPIEDRPTYTAKEGATVKRTGRSWDELAVEAYGHASYAIYLRNFPYNSGQISQEQAYQDYQADQNNNNNNGGPPNPHDDELIPGGGNQNTYNGPSYPSYQAYIPTMGEIVELHENSVWQQRFEVPGVLQHAHWFENYEMIAQFAYGDADLKEQLKSHNISVTEIKEGSTITLPSADELGPPWIEVDPMTIGSTSMQVWVGPDDNRDPEMWMGSPDRLVTELAQEALENEDTESAAQQLMEAATFGNDTSQVEAENAVNIASNLIDYILASSGSTAGAGQAWVDASQGDTINIHPDQLGQAAEAVYGHAERAAWIAVFNENTGGGGQTASQSTSEKSGGSSQMQMAALSPKNIGTSSGPRNYKLPTWTEMATLDPLPAAKRGVAPRSTIEVVNGDTWSSIAQKAYGDWSKALPLAELDANAGTSLEPGAIVTLPIASGLTSNTIAATADMAVAGPVLGGKTTTTTDTQAIDDRVFSPGSTIKAKAGDTWSALALATYDDFALFVRLSNHPLNVTVKTLPEGVDIYLPTQDELMNVPEFGLGLSPTGRPLLTEMVRVPTSEELHHVWVENKADEGQEVDAVWMMASTPFELEPESEEWVTKTEGDDAVAPAAKEINRAAKEKEESIDEVQDMPARLRKIVDGDYFDESGEGGASEHGHINGGVDPEVKVKLYGLEETYELYMRYMFYQGTATQGMYIAAIFMDTPMEKVGRDLQASLEAHGFKDYLEFRSYINKFLKGFEEEAAKTLTDTLGTYKDSLCDEQSRYQSLAEVQALQEALVCGDHDGFAILNDETLPEDKKIPRSEWMAADATTLMGLVEAYILIRIQDVEEARGRVTDDPKLIFKLEGMLPFFYSSQGFEQGSIYDMIIQNKIQDDNITALIIGILGAIVAIALTIVSLGAATPAIIAAGAAAGAFGLSSYFAFQEYQKYVVENDMADVGMMDDPSVVWLVVAIVGAALDMGAAVKAVRALAPAAKLLDAGGEVTDFTRAVQALEEIGEIDAKIAKAANRAAQARSTFKTASEDLTILITRLGVNPFLDPQIYFAMVRMGIAKITEGVSEFHQFVLQLKAAKRAAGIVDDLSAEELTKAKQAWMDALRFINSADEPVEILGRGANPKVIGRFSKGSFLELISRRTNLYGGNMIRLAEGKTTTILGNMDSVGKVRFRGEQMPGITMQGANPGGINSLFSPRWGEIVAKHKHILDAGDSATYWRTVTNQFWDEVNGPWLQQAIARGDQMRLVADPNDAKMLSRILDDGSEMVTIFAREKELLQRAGYTILADGTAVL